MYIQKQANGTYRVWVRRRGRSMSATFDRKADAEAYGRKAEVAIEAGATIQFRKIKSNTLGDLLRLYEKNVASGRRYPVQERQRIRHWLDTSLAKRSLDSLSTADFARYRDARKRAGRADNTVRLELAFVSRLYNLARKEWGYDGLENPIADLQKPGGSRARERRLMPGEFYRLYKQLRRAQGNVWAAHAFALAIETTLRQGSLFSLKWQWIDIQRRVIRIPATARTAENKGIPPSLPLTKRAIKILRRLYQMKAGQEVFGCTANAVVCAWKRAKADARRTYEDSCTRIGCEPDDAYLRDLRWHDLRHEGISRLFELGLHPLQVQRISGHKTMQMLLRYTHLQTDGLLAALDGDKRHAD
ncbi:tyrosine-type recombinase/integrase [Bordetella sp. 15P40C-2]|nr:tyrosine-type recombinase/integrase [Bordetella sp. 15P40C-2]